LDRIGGDADPAKGEEDAEARAASAMLKPIVFRGARRDIYSIRTPLAFP
jgi:hypothetical protein